MTVANYAQKQITINFLVEEDNFFYSCSYKDLMRK